jgi:hypothetical protein
MEQNFEAMLPRRRFFVGGHSLCLALVVAIGCGGSTRESVGTGSGGTSGQDGGAGVSGAAGDGAGGAGAGGAGGTGAVGAGGSAGMPALCKLPADSGNCLAYNPSFFHNPATGVCEPFVYGNCGGNENRFGTREECQAACRGGAPDMDACSRTSECMALEIGCCGSCEQGDDHAFVAINRRYHEAFSQTRACTGITCGPCPEPDELTTTSQYFGSICLEGACTIVDIRKTAATECVTGSDCELRDGAACCNGCDGRGLVSVRPQAFFELVCADFDQGCPPCVPNIPPEFVQQCIGGRCTVQRLTR